MKTLVLLCLAGLAAATDTRISRIAVYGFPDSVPFPETAKYGNYFPFPYIRNVPSHDSKVPLKLNDIVEKPMTLLIKHPSDPSKLVAYRLHGGISSLESGSKNPALRPLMEAFQPAHNKMGVIAYPWELPAHMSTDYPITRFSVLPDKQTTKLSDLARETLRRDEELYLMIRGKTDLPEFRTDKLREVGELEVLDDAVKVVRDPYSLSLFPLRYYNPYSYQDSYVDDFHKVNPLLYHMAHKPRYPFFQNQVPLYDENQYQSDFIHRPYLPNIFRLLLNYYRNLYRPHLPYYRLRNLQYDDSYEDDYLRYDVYSHPTVKPIAIVPGDEYAMYYPSSYPILSTVPVVPAPAPPIVEPVPPISAIGAIAPLAVPSVKVAVNPDEI